LADSLVVVREVIVVNSEGFHARPVMMFTDMAKLFRANIAVTNISQGHEVIDGKSPMHLMLLNAPKGSQVRISAEGEDAEAAVAALVGLVQRGFVDEAQ